MTTTSQPTPEDREIAHRLFTQLAISELIGAPTTEARFRHIYEAFAQVRAEAVAAQWKQPIELPTEVRNAKPPRLGDWVKRVDYANNGDAWVTMFSNPGGQLLGGWLVPTPPGVIGKE